MGFQPGFERIGLNLKIYIQELKEFLLYENTEYKSETMQLIDLEFLSIFISLIISQYHILSTSDLEFAISYHGIPNHIFKI